ncbi:nuclear transport factor 2 family protein [Spirosoma pollinicola]|uniref:Nuclear transport factor 2 family protein n=1 Tax=Spirosoma pollinicola TaxID=2057025 RepID=A0A2K8Z6W6_9BACT|nr:hypothetical protein [Spirosoma pollinicola]AUD05574.1 hypothetical protein CWM47_29265 [Spirosoma pollinicola]
MNQTLNNYAIAVAEGDKASLAATFATNVKIMQPAGNQPIDGVGKAATMLSAALIAIENFKLVRTFEKEENWGAVVFEGQLDGNVVQLIDQVYLDENNLINHVDVFFRPTAMAEMLLDKMAAAIQLQASKALIA